MSDDLIARLRRHSTSWSPASAIAAHQRLHAEAADEIERLREYLTQIADYADRPIVATLAREALATEGDDGG